MDMHLYYDKRAKEYDDIYRRDDPVSRAELGRMAGDMQHAMAGRTVLEVAFGTGHWTNVIMDTATRIVAIDASPAMLEVAQSKAFPAEKVTFRLGDAYALSPEGGPFSAGLAMFWFSHIPKARVQEFLLGFHAVLQPGATVFLGDNQFRDLAGGEFVQKDGDADTYRLRTLADGSQHEIIKNYYDEAALQAIFEPIGTDLQIVCGEHFWWLTYKTA